jgi:hypothetical protein
MQKVTKTHPTHRSPQQHPSLTTHTTPTPPTMSSTTQPINLVSVNTAPERAKRLIGILIDSVKDRYNIVHAGNSESEFFRGGQLRSSVSRSRDIEVG